MKSFWPTFLPWKRIACPHRPKKGSGGRLDVKLEHTRVCGWPAIRRSCGDLSVGVVPSAGGRIMSLVFAGLELLFAPAAFPLEVPCANADLREFKRRTGFLLPGGSKVWPAPEKEWWEGMPPVDLDRACFSVTQDDVDIILTSPVCRETGLRVTRRITFPEHNRLRVTEMFENAGTVVVNKGLWTVTQVPRPFDVYFPCPVQCIRSYHIDDRTLPDPGQQAEICGVYSHLPVHSQVCFKFGAWYSPGSVLLLKKSAQKIITFLKSFSVDTSSPYAHSSVVEVFNSALAPYGELEIHSPVYCLSPGERASFSQEWSFGSYSPDTPLDVILQESFAGLA